LSFITGGEPNLPISASDFGAYRRIVRLNGPFWRGKPFYFQTPFPALKIDRPKMKKRAMSRQVAFRALFSLVALCVQN
jgi:hypothetical protein